MAYPGFQRGGCLRSGPIRKVGGGGGGGGGGGNSLQVRYEKWGGGGGGGGADTFVWHKENTLSLNINGLTKGGPQALHTRARKNLMFVFNCIHSLIVFILETEGGARAPEPPPPPPPKYATECGIL